MTEKSRTKSLCLTKTHLLTNAYGSISEKDPCLIQITPQHNSLKT